MATDLGERGLNEVPLPALTAQRPHQWMAALGATRLLSNVQLRWDHDRGHAILVGPTDLDQVVARLAEVVTDLTRRKAVLPNVPGGWPPPRPGTRGHDPAQRWDDPQALNQLFGLDATTWWSACLARDYTRRRVVRSPYIHRRGLQSVRSFFEAPLTHLRDDPATVLRACLTVGWRVRGYSGELLDAGAHADDGPVWGDPGQTWLAAMAMPLLGPVGVSTDGRAIAPCWPTPDLMSWPQWSPPLDAHAIAALLTMPHWMPGARTVEDGDSMRVDPDRAGWTVDPTLAGVVGVRRVWSAQRQQTGASKYDLPLAAGSVVGWRG